LSYDVSNCEQFATFLEEKKMLTYFRLETLVYLLTIYRPVDGAVASGAY
jgi:hypothetical protein